jgi:two-component system phosphate regulon sensor histidine kinase PhoR
MADRSYRANLSGALSYAAAGLIVGALIVTTTGTLAWWLVVIVAAVLLAVALGGAGRKAASPTEASLPPGQAGELPLLAREILETVPDPLMLIDGSARVIFANHAMQAVIGTDTERKSIAAVLRAPAVLQAVERTQDTGEASTAEFVERVPVERHYRALIARMEQPPQLTAILLHDLTALKRAEQARADFIANASHELRTPLAAVTGFIETLRGHARNDESARDKFLGIMNVEAQRMRRLIEDLLSLTRIELNEHVPPSGEVDLEGVVRDAAAALSPLAEADDVSVLIEAPNDLPPVRGDLDELIQVFQNLIHNGVKYGNPGGHVWVTLSAPADAVSLGRGGKAMVSAIVRDDGEGIPREAIPRLTERFYRVDVKRSRERGGTGLGLAIVKHIINRHQGRLTIESQAGEGSTFTILLPAAMPAVENPPASVTELL